MCPLFFESFLMYTGRWRVRFRRRYHVHPLPSADADLRVLPFPARPGRPGGVPAVSQDGGSRLGPANAHRTSCRGGLRPLRGLLPAQDHLRLRREPAASQGRHRALHVVRRERPRVHGALQRLPDPEALHGLQQEAAGVQARQEQVQGLHRGRVRVSEESFFFKNTGS